MEEKKEYNISMKKGVLVFTTTSFRADEGSVLHSGVYNRELTSALSSGTVLMACAFGLVYMGVKLSVPLIALGVAGFFALMVISRKYVFFEEFLRVEVDKDRNEVTFFKKALRSTTETVSMDLLRSIRWGLTFHVPANPDGVGVVKRISASHGMPIPDFGEPREIHSVVFEFTDERDIMVFSSEDQDEVDAVLEMMKNFVGGRIAQAD